MRLHMGAQLGVLWYSVHNASGRTTKHVARTAAPSRPASSSAVSVPLS